MKEFDISWISLSMSILMLVIPLLIFIRYKTGLVKPAIIAFLRMVMQLFLMGIYLKYLFQYDNIFLNLLWVVVIVIAAGFTIGKRSGVNIREYALPFILSIGIGLLSSAIFIALLVMDLDTFTRARYIIPISGMLIGNTLNITIVGIRSFFTQLRKEEEKFRYSLMCGATSKEALYPFIKEALILSGNPTIANMASIGLIWLPGMMTGQILAGSNPAIAIKYQIVIMAGIFSTSIVSLFSSIYLGRKIAFDKYGKLKPINGLSSSKA